jgi:hypothetical protein
MDRTMHMMQFFKYDHLPPHLQKVSKMFGDLAVELVGDLPDNPETEEAIRNLLIAKDAAVRASLAKPVSPQAKEKDE